MRLVLWMADLIGLLSMRELVQEQLAQAAVLLAAEVVTLLEP